MGGIVPVIMRGQLMVTLNSHKLAIEVIVKRGIRYYRPRLTVASDIVATCGCQLELTMSRHASFRYNNISILFHAVAILPI